MIKNLILFSIFCFSVSCSLKNKAKSQVNLVKIDSFKLAFWNIENLFDTIDDPNIVDEEFTPTGKSKWNSEVYNAKLVNLSKTINDLNADVIGLGEVENSNVLKDLIQLCKKNYKIVHYNSPDERGIDVALLFNKTLFKELSSKNILVKLNDTNTTRDILHVKLQHILSNEILNVFVNHWPSRRNGQSASNPWRCKAAEILSENMENVKSEACIAIGDLNDGPKDSSIIECLKACYPGDTLANNCLFYNLARFIKTDKEGSHKYAGKWNMLDQMIISKNVWPSNKGNIYFQPYSFKVFNPTYLITQTGKYAGTPSRGMSGNIWVNGYSDHLPIIAQFKVVIR